MNFIYQKNTYSVSSIENGIITAKLSIKRTKYLTAENIKIDIAKKKIIAGGFLGNYFKTLSHIEFNNILRGIRGPYGKVKLMSIPKKVTNVYGHIDMNDVKIAVVKRPGTLGEPVLKISRHGRFPEYLRCGEVLDCRLFSYTTNPVSYTVYKK